MVEESGLPRMNQRRWDNSSLENSDNFIFNCLFLCLHRRCLVRKLINKSFTPLYNLQPIFYAKRFCYETGKEMREKIVLLCHKRAQKLFLSHRTQHFIGLNKRQRHYNKYPRLKMIKITNYCLPVPLLKRCEKEKRTFSGVLV